MCHVVIHYTYSFYQRGFFKFRTLSEFLFIYSFFDCERFQLKDLGGKIFKISKRNQG